MEKDVLADIEVDVRESTCKAWPMSSDLMEFFVYEEKNPSTW